MAGSRRALAALTVTLLALCTSACSGDADPAAPPTPEHEPTLSIPEDSPSGSTGSDGSDPDKTASPDDAPASKDLSPKEQKAADAAIAAFKKYLRVSDQVMHDGGRHPERLKTVATGVMLAADQNDAASFLKSHQHVVGRSIFDHLSIKQVRLPDDRSLASPTVKIDACVDVHRTEVQREDGSTVEQNNRKLRWPSTYIVAKADDAWLIQNLIQGRGKC